MLLALFRFYIDFNVEAEIKNYIVVRRGEVGELLLFVSNYKTSLISLKA